MEKKKPSTCVCIILGLHFAIHMMAYGTSTSIMYKIVVIHILYFIYFLNSQEVEEACKFLRIVNMYVCEEK